METSVTVDRPVEAVWKLIADYAKYPMWAGCLESEQTSVGQFGVGATWREKRSRMPKVMDFRVTECEPSLKFAFEIISGPIRGSMMTYNLESAQGKTKVTEKDDFNLSGMLKLLGPFVDRPENWEKEATDRLLSLKHVMESETRSEPGARA